MRAWKNNRGSQSTTEEEEPNGGRQDRPDSEQASPTGGAGGETLWRRDEEGDDAEGRGGSLLHTVYRMVGNTGNPVKGNPSIRIDI
jgi:hypothetical protein